MQAAVYVRLNRDRQQRQCQLEGLRQYIIRRGWTLVATYVDGSTRAPKQSTEFKRLLADATRKQFDVVIVPRLTHLARSLTQLIATLEHLRRAGVGVVSLMEDVDTSIPEGDLVFRGIVAVGQFQRALTTDRIRAGLERARALGAQVGRPTAHVAPDQVRACRESGLSYREIGRRLGISPALAHRLARDAALEDGHERSRPTREMATGNAPRRVRWGRPRPGPARAPHGEENR